MAQCKTPWCSNQDLNTRYYGLLPSQREAGQLSGPLTDWYVATYYDLAQAMGPGLFITMASVWFHPPYQRRDSCGCRCRSVLCQSMCWYQRRKGLGWQYPLRLDLLKNTCDAIIPTLTQTNCSGFASALSITFADNIYAATDTIHWLFTRQIVYFFYYS